MKYDDAKTTQPTPSRGCGRAWLLTFVVPASLLMEAAVASPTSLVKTTDWLAANLNRPDVRVVDLRYGIEYYWEAHVPGAVHLYPDVLTWPENGVPSKPIPAEAFARLLGNMGIADSTTVVACSEVIDSLSPYFTWLLDYMGHKQQALIAGELDRWRSEGRPLTPDFPRIQPVVYHLPAQLNENVRARLADVKAALGDKRTVILDVRSPAMYSGAAGYTKRRGHIPGAINRPWLRDLAGDYTWRDSTELKKEYEALGVTPDKRIIIYCTRGYRSTTTYVTLKHVLGYPNVAVYDGSFSEWSEVDSLPIATSIAPTSNEPALEAVSFRWDRTEGGYFVKAEGQVKNISSKSLENVVAVVTFKDRSGGFVTSSDALISYNPILPGQTSPFSVTVTDNPAIGKAHVEFEFLMGGTISTRHSE